jgi:hypothetical protein
MPFRFADYASTHPDKARVTEIVASGRENPYQEPVFCIDIHGSAGARLSPFCKISKEIPSGERTKAM